MYTSRPLLRALLTAVLASVLLAAILRPTSAQSAGDLRASARDISNEIAAQKSGGSFNTAAQQRAVERLGKLSLSFISLCDRTSNAGGEGRDRDALAGAYQAI